MQLGMKAFLLFIVLLGAQPAMGVAHGQSQSPVSLWDTTDQDADQYKLLMDKGDSLILAASRYWVRDRRRSIQFATLAKDAYLLAVKADPTAADPHYKIATLTLAYFSYRPAPPSKYLKQQVLHCNLFEKKSPFDSRLSSVYFWRAIALTKLADKASLTAAIIDYDKELATYDLSNPLVRSDSANVIGNRAEVLMMLGRLRESISGYELAIDYGNDTVHGYGLAVALDRNGQYTRARQVVTQFARHDASNALSNSGTFFVPAGERYYYIALREEGRGNPVAAIAAYQTYLRLVPTSPWTTQAQSNIKILIKKSGKLSKHLRALRF